jgi:hypothetical protein
LSEWTISGGPERPFWEPVRLIDFADERGAALRRLRQQLNETPRDQLDDGDLTMHAILELIFARGTVRLDQVRSETLRLATQMLPDPGRGKRKRLPSSRRDDLIVAVGHVWTVFISHNFPLNQPGFEPEAEPEG